MMMHNNNKQSSSPDDWIPNVNSSSSSEEQPPAAAGDDFLINCLGPYLGQTGNNYNILKIARKIFDDKILPFFHALELDIIRRGPYTVLDYHLASGSISVKDFIHEAVAIWEKVTEITNKKIEEERQLIRQNVAMSSTSIEDDCDGMANKNNKKKKRVFVTSEEEDFMFAASRNSIENGLFGPAARRYEHLYKDEKQRNHFLHKAQSDAFFAKKLEESKKGMQALYVVFGTQLASALDRLDAERHQEEFYNQSKIDEAYNQHQQQQQKDREYLHTYYLSPITILFNSRTKVGCYCVGKYTILSGRHCSCKDFQLHLLNSTGSGSGSGVGGFHNNYNQHQQHASSSSSTIMCKHLLALHLAFGFNLPTLPPPPPSHHPGLIASNFLTSLQYKKEVLEALELNKIFKRLEVVGGSIIEKLIQRAFQSGQFGVANTVSSNGDGTSMMTNGTGRVDVMRNLDRDDLNNLLRLVYRNIDKKKTPKAKKKKSNNNNAIIDLNENEEDENNQEDCLVPDTNNNNNNNPIEEAAAVVAGSQEHENADGGDDDEDEDEEPQQDLFLPPHRRYTQGRVRTRYNMQNQLMLSQTPALALQPEEEDFLLRCSQQQQHWESQQQCDISNHQQQQQQMMMMFTNDNNKNHNNNNAALPSCHTTSLQQEPLEMLKTCLTYHHHNNDDGIMPYSSIDAATDSNYPPTKRTTFILPRDKNRFEVLKKEEEENNNNNNQNIDNSNVDNKVHQHQQKKNLLPPNLCFVPGKDIIDTYQMPITSSLSSSKSGTNNSNNNRTTTIDIDVPIPRFSPFLDFIHTLDSIDLQELNILKSTTGEERARNKEMRRFMMMAMMNNHQQQQNATNQIRGNNNYYNNNNNHPTTGNYLHYSKRNSLWLFWLYHHPHQHQHHTSAPNITSSTKTTTTNNNNNNNNQRNSYYQNNNISNTNISTTTDYDTAAGVFKRDRLLYFSGSVSWVAASDVEITEKMMKPIDDVVKEQIMK